MSEERGNPTLETLLVGLGSDVERLIAEIGQASARPGGDSAGSGAVTRPAEPRVRHLQARAEAIRRASREAGKELSRLRRRSAMFGCLSESIADAFFVLDRGGRIVDMSDRALESLGYEGSRPPSLYLWDIAPIPGLEAYRRIWDWIVESGQPWATDSYHIRSDGSTFDVRVRACIARLDDEEYLLAQSWDTTQEAKARAERERLVEILEATPDLVGIAHPDGSVVFVNQAGRRLMGFAPDEDVTRARIHDFHPRWAAETIMNEAIPAAREHGVWVGETAVVGRGGVELPTSQVVIAHRDAQGEVQALSTIIRDIADLRAGDERQRALVQAIPDLLFRLSIDGTFLDFQAGPAITLAMPRDRIVGANLTEGPLPSHTAVRVLELVRAAIQSGQPKELRYELEVPDGTRHFECRIVKSGEREALAIVRDVTAQVRAEALQADHLRRLKTMAETDPLTGLLNSEAIRRKLELAVAGSRSTDRAGALLYLDLDGFKPVNDGMGHDRGDRVLREMAARIATCLRGSDAVGRIGGDEFAIVLADVSQDRVIGAVARKLLTAVAERYPMEERELVLTASIGIARFPADGTSARELVRLADEAMYRVKREGGDAYGFCDSESPEGQPVTAQ